MPRKTSKMRMLGELQQISAMLAANSEELAHLEVIRQRFDILLSQAMEAANRQAVLTASKQEVSQQLQGVLTEALRMANFLLLGVKVHYGTRSEKLTEFGLQPFRGRKARKAPEPEAEPEAVPLAAQAAEIPL